jgi:hypothetical protein
MSGFIAGDNEGGHAAFEVMPRRFVFRELTCASFPSTISGDEQVNGAAQSTLAVQRRRRSTANSRFVLRGVTGV